MNKIIANTRTRLEKAAKKTTIKTTITVEHSLAPDPTVDAFLKSRVDGAFFDSLGDSSKDAKAQKILKKWIKDHSEDLKTIPIIIDGVEYYAKSSVITVS